MVTFVTARPIQRWSYTLNRTPFIENSSSDAGSVSETLPLPVDVYETADEFVVNASLPGVPADSIQVFAEDGVMSIGATVPEPPQRASQVRWLSRQRPYGRMGRSIQLPKSLDLDGASTSLADGVLTISVPKQASARARRIEINTTERPAIEATAREVNNEISGD